MYVHVCVFECEVCAYGYVHMYILHVCAGSTCAFASVTSSRIIHVQEGQLDAF